MDVNPPEETLKKIKQGIKENKYQQYYYEINHFLTSSIFATTRDIWNTDKKDKIQASVKNVMQGALRLTGAVALGAAGKDLADGIINNEANSIESLRKELDLIVKHIKDSNKNEFFRMVIYVDDLDRMNPPEAVRLLELL